MALLVTAWLAAKLLRRHSAAARHLVWTSACAAVLVLPFLSLSLPAVGWPGSPALLRLGVVYQATAFATSATLGSGAALPTAVARLTSRGWHLDWPLTLLLLWAAGAAVAFVQTLVGWAAMWRVRQIAGRFPAPEIDTLKHALGIRRKVDLFKAPRGTMPMAFGLLHPGIFMPADAEDWTPHRRHLVLLHELAHLKVATSQRTCSREPP